MIYVSALDAYYVVVRKHSQPDELDHSSHHSPSTTALYVLLAPEKKRNKATINLKGPHLSALYKYANIHFHTVTDRAGLDTNLY